MGRDLAARSLTFAYRRHPEKGSQLWAFDWSDGQEKVGQRNLGRLSDGGLKDSEGGLTLDKNRKSCVGKSDSRGSDVVDPNGHRRSVLARWRGVFNAVEQGRYEGR